MRPVPATDAQEVILWERLQRVVDFEEDELIPLAKILFSSRVREIVQIASGAQQLR